MAENFRDLVKMQHFVRNHFADCVPCPFMPKSDRKTFPDGGNTAIFVKALW